MAYRFKRRESVADAFRRIVDEEAAALIAALKATGNDGVHAARKRCKMLRALLELLDGAAEKRACAKADESLEKIARALAPVRDAEVRLQTLEGLLTGAGARSPQRFAGARSLLQAQAASARRLSLTPADLRDVAALVRTGQERLLALQLDRKGWDALGPGLTRTYRRGRRSFEKGLGDPSPENRHQWRTRVKLLWYHVRLLHGCQPKKLGTLEAKLAALGETLGIEHDLATLRQHLAQHGRRHRSPAAFDGVIDLIDKRRTFLRRTADALGRKLYAEKAGDFARRMKHAWHAWRK